MSARRLALLLLVPLAAPGAALALQAVRLRPAVQVEFQVDAERVSNAYLILQGLEERVAASIQRKLVEQTFLRPPTAQERTDQAFSVVLVSLTGKGRSKTTLETAYLDFRVSRAAHALEDWLPPAQSSLSWRLWDPVEIAKQDEGPVFTEASLLKRIGDRVDALLGNVDLLTTSVLCFLPITPSPADGPWRVVPEDDGFGRSLILPFQSADVLLLQGSRMLLHMDMPDRGRSFCQRVVSVSRRGPVRVEADPAGAPAQAPADEQAADEAADPMVEVYVDQVERRTAALLRPFDLYWTMGLAPGHGEPAPGVDLLGVIVLDPVPGDVSQLVRPSQAGAP